MGRALVQAAARQAITTSSAPRRAAVVRRGSEVEVGVDVSADVDVDVDIEVVVNMPVSMSMSRARSKNTAICEAVIFP